MSSFIHIMVVEVIFHNSSTEMPVFGDEIVNGCFATRCVISWDKLSAERKVLTLVIKQLEKHFDSTTFSKSEIQIDSYRRGNIKELLAPFNKGFTFY